MQKILVEKIHTEYHIIQLFWNLKNKTHKLDTATSVNTIAYHSRRRKKKNMTRKIEEETQRRRNDRQKG